MQNLNVYNNFYEEQKSRTKKRNSILKFFLGPADGSIVLMTWRDPNNKSHKHEDGFDKI